MSRKIKNRQLFPIALTLKWLIMPGKKSIILLVLLTYPILFIGCDFRKLHKKQLEIFVPQEADTLARDYIDIILKGDIEKAEELLDPQVVSSKTRPDLQKCIDYLNKAEPISIENVNFTLFKFKDKRRYNLTYQLQLINAWLLANVIVDETSGILKILGFQVKTIPRSLEEINAFTFSGKSIRHYIILLIAIGIPLFIIYAIVLCVRTKMKRKWLWIIFMLLGFGRYSFNWTSGQMGFTPIAFQLFSAGFFRKGLYAPWIIYISVPIGALLFILKRRKIRKSESVDVSRVHDSNDKVIEDDDS